VPFSQASFSSLTCLSIDGCDRDYYCRHMQRENAGAVSFDCKQDLFRQDVENAGDLRLSVSLLRLCMGEKQVFCPLAEPGAPSVVLHLVVLSCATLQAERHGEVCNFQPQWLLLKSKLGCRPVDNAAFANSCRKLCACAMECLEEHCNTEGFV